MDEDTKGGGVAGVDSPLEQFPFALARGTGSSSLFESVIHHSGDATCADHALTNESIDA
jgi:hypothetical protein